MHVLGHGEPVALAHAIHDAIVLSKTPLGNTPPAAAQQIDLDTAMIDQVLGAHGQTAGGVYQIGIPRADTIKAHGMAIPAPMGSAEAINFQPTGGGKAARTQLRNVLSARLRRKAAALFAGLTSVLLFSPAQSAEPVLPLVLETTIPLPNVAGRIDHLAVDLGRKRLFVAEVGNNTLDA